MKLQQEICFDRILSLKIHTVSENIEDSLLRVEELLDVTRHIYLKTNRVVSEDIGDIARCGRSVRQYRRCTEHSRRISIPSECIVDFCIHTPSACTAIGTLACNPQAN